MENRLIESLNSFRPWERAEALQVLARTADFPARTSDFMNMHAHSFFSSNGEGWSPSRLAYEFRRMGLYGAALCDFDVLHGLKEFLCAGDMLSLRTAVSFECRVFFKEYANAEINSPGEPGVFYFMGSGFVDVPADGTPAAAAFGRLLEQSHSRNRALIDRINGKLPAARLDYDRDVLPLTPEGNATERHIVRAYYDVAVREQGSPEAAADFWAKCFQGDPAELRALAGNTNKFVEYLRGKLMKKGGLGYVQPGEATFPPLDEVVALIRSCRALPCAAWLDGSLPGEANPKEQLECLLGKGLELVNVIPDRNWNFADPEKRAKKVKALNEYMKVVEELELPAIAGTECNKPGQRTVDDFACDALAPHLPAFLKGAQVLVGHTTLLRFADCSYMDAQSVSQWPSRRARNDFFASVGALPAPDAKTLARLCEAAPAENFAYIADCAAAGKWL